MTVNAEELELKDRLNLIETMIAEGRRTTESWGWVFVLWGVAYYVAIAWSAWGPQCAGLAHHHGRRNDSHVDRRGMAHRREAAKTG